MKRLDGIPESMLIPLIARAKEYESFIIGFSYSYSFARAIKGINIDSGIPSSRFI
jgi:hypothetical protein